MLIIGGKSLIGGKWNNDSIKQKRLRGSHFKAIRDKGITTPF
jgi:hypothetical protein